MKVRVRVLTATLCAVFAGIVPQSVAPTAARAAQQPAAQSSPAQYRTGVDKYCVTCHNERTKTAGLALDGLDMSNVASGADVWEKVVRKVRVGMMPPQGAPRPDQETAHALVAALTTSLDQAWSAKPNPGR